MYKKLLGNFNIYPLSNEVHADIDNVLTEYVVMVTEPTNNDGGSLDHMYLQIQFLMRKQANSKLNSVHISDYDAVKTNILKEEELEDDRLYSTMVKLL